LLAFRERFSSSDSPWYVSSDTVGVLPISSVPVKHFSPESWSRPPSHCLPCYAQVVSSRKLPSSFCCLFVPCFFFLHPSLEAMSDAPPTTCFAFLNRVDRLSFSLGALSSSTLGEAFSRVRPVAGSPSGSFVFFAKRARLWWSEVRGSRSETFFARAFFPRPEISAYLLMAVAPLSPPHGLWPALHFWLSACSFMLVLFGTGPLPQPPYFFVLSFFFLFQVLLRTKADVVRFPPRNSLAPHRPQISPSVLSGVPISPFFFFPYFFRFFSSDFPSFQPNFRS